MDIFWDAPERYLEGEVTAIHIADDEFCPISLQSCDFMEAIFEYDGKMLEFEYMDHEECDTIGIGDIGAFNPQVYKYTLRPGNDEKIKFEKIVYSEDGEIEGMLPKRSMVKEPWRSTFI